MSGHIRSRRTRPETESTTAPSRSEATEAAAVSNASAQEGVTADEESPGILESLLGEEAQTAAKNLDWAAGTVDVLQTRMDMAGDVYKRPGGLRRLFGARTLKHKEAAQKLGKLQKTLRFDAQHVENQVPLHMVLPGAQKDVQQTADGVSKMVEKEYPRDLRRIGGHLAPGAPLVSAPKPSPVDITTDAPDEEARADLGELEASLDAEAPAVSGDADVPAAKVTEGTIPKDPALITGASKAAAHIQGNVLKAKAGYRSPPRKLKHDEVAQELGELSTGLQVEGDKAQEAEAVAVQSAMVTAKSSVDATQAKITDKVEPIHPQKLGLVGTGLAKGATAMMEQAFTDELIDYDDLNVHGMVDKGGSGSFIFGVDYMGMGDFIGKVGINKGFESEGNTLEDKLDIEAALAGELGEDEHLFGAFGNIDRKNKGKKAGRMMLMERAECDMKEAFSRIRDDTETDSDKKVELIAYMMKGGLQGLKKMHTKGIVHSDIKGGNMFLDANLTPTMADFGLSHASDDKTADVRMGTPTHMAPEAVAEIAGIESDMWSMGETLLEALFGEDKQSGWVSGRDDAFNVDVYKATQLRDDAWQLNLEAKIDEAMPDLSPDKKAQLIDLMRGKEEVDGTDRRTGGLMTFDKGKRMDVDGALASELMTSVNDEEAAEELRAVMDRFADKEAARALAKKLADEEEARKAREEEDRRLAEEATRSAEDPSSDHPESSVATTEVITEPEVEQLSPAERSRAIVRQAIASLNELKAAQPKVSWIAKKFGKYDARAALDGVAADMHSAMTLDTRNDIQETAWRAVLNYEQSPEAGKAGLAFDVSAIRKLLM